MPRGDGTGPAGMGPMTGRGAGFCAGYSTPGYMNPASGFGRGWGRGWGRGFGRGAGWGRPWAAPYAAPAYAPGQVPYAAAPTREQELDMLKGQAQGFETALSEIQSRIGELEAQGTKSK